MVKNVKLGILESSFEVLQKLSKEQQVGIRTAYNILNTYKKIEDILKIFYSKKISLYEKFGDKVGEIIKIRTEEENNFLKEYEVLINEEMELDIPNITIDDLDKIKISVEDLNKIIWIINDK